MKERGFGGANTLTGLNFEREVDFQDLLAAKPGYEVKPVAGKAGKGFFLKVSLSLAVFGKMTSTNFSKKKA